MQQMTQMQGMLQDYLSCKEETKEYDTYLSTATGAEDQLSTAS